MLVLRLLLRVRKGILLRRRWGKRLLLRILKRSLVVSALVVAILLVLLVPRMNLYVGLRRGLLLMLRSVGDFFVKRLVDLTRNLTDGVVVEGYSGGLRRGLNVRLVSSIVIFDLVDVLEGRGVRVEALLRLMGLGWSLGQRSRSRWA